jgi:hypothetical protein
MTTHFHLVRPIDSKAEFCWIDALMTPHRAAIQLTKTTSSYTFIGCSSARIDRAWPIISESASWQVREDIALGLRRLIGDHV